MSLRRRVGRGRLLRTVVVWAALSEPVLPHDFWLLPPEPPPSAGQPVVLRAATGMDFPRSESAVAPERIVRVFVRLPDGVEIAPRDLGREDAFLLVRLPESVEGTTVAAIETAPRVLRLSAEEFNEYLREDGLPETLAWREKEGRLEEDAVERYSKFAKVIFRTGKGGPSGSVATPLGLPLEIVPRADPTRLEPGSELRFQVLFRGDPLAGAQVGFDRPGTGEGVAGVRTTDERGEAAVQLPESGLFTLRLVKMTRPASEDFEWESFWASLTFRVGG